MVRTVIFYNSSNFLNPFQVMEENDLENELEGDSWYWLNRYKAHGQEERYFVESGMNCGADYTIKIYYSLKELFEDVLSWGDTFEGMAKTLNDLSKAFLAATDQNEITDLQ